MCLLDSVMLFVFSGARAPKKTTTKKEEEEEEEEEEENQARTPPKVPKMTPWGSLKVRLELHCGLCTSRQRGSSPGASHQRKPGKSPGGNVQNSDYHL